MCCNPAIHCWQYWHPGDGNGNSALPPTFEMCTPLQFCNHQGCNQRFCVISCCLHSSLWTRAEKSWKKSGISGGVGNYVLPVSPGTFSLQKWKHLLPLCSSFLNLQKYPQVLASLKFVCLSHMRKSALSCHAVSVTQPPSAWSHYVCLMQKITSATLSSSVLNFCCIPFAANRLKSWNTGNCWQVLCPMPESDHLPRSVICVSEFLFHMR